MKLIDTESDVSAQDAGTAKIIGDHLNIKYPGHLWAINVSWKRGTANIQCLDLPMKYGYVLKLHKTYSASELEHRAMVAAGEILERYGLKRGKWDGDSIANLPTDHLGNIVGDLS